MCFQPQDPKNANCKVIAAQKNVGHPISAVDKDFAVIVFAKLAIT